MKPLKTVRGSVGSHVNKTDASKSYQTLQEPGRPGDDDENLLHQLDDD